MKKTVIAVVVASIAVGLAAVSGAFAAHVVKGKAFYEADLQPIEGASYEQDAEGTANLRLKKNKLKVSIEATDLVAKERHPQHIHGFEDKSDATCPTIAQDDDGNGFVSVPEGEDTYGPILLPLKKFPKANAKGTIKFTKQYKIDKDELEPLENREIVIHGGIQEGEYNPTLPVLCGQITPDAQD